MSGDLSGFSLFDLFKLEAQSHSAVLSDGLLAIESQPDDLTKIEGLMRAAHSIKGAARIVGLDSVVGLAHAMEDCFVSVQRGSERLTSARVDQLLQGVDIIQSLSELSEQQVTDWSAEHAPACEQLSERLRQPSPVPQEMSAAPPDSVQHDTPVRPSPTAAVTDDSTDRQLDGPMTSPTDAKSLKSDEAPVSTATSTPRPATDREISATAEPSGTEASEAETSSSSAEEADEPAPDTRTIPVSASNLHHIMRLASESMIDAGRLQKTQRGLSVLRDTQRRFSALLDQWNRTDRQAEPSSAVIEELRMLNRLVEDRLQDHANQLEKAFWSVERTSTALYHQVIGSRMRPFREGTLPFPRMIRDLARALGKQVQFQILGETVAVDRDILRKLEAPLNHILRNALDHGIETPSDREAAGKPPGGSVTLEARHHAGMLTVEVRDDGRGIDPESIRRKVVDRGLANESMAAGMTEEELFEFLFLAGFTTAAQVTEVSGRGVGLDVVRSMVQGVSGTIRVASVPRQGTTFTLRLPVTLSVLRAVLAEIGGEPYAFPLAKLVRIVRVPREEIQPVQGKQQFSLNDQCVGLVRASEVFGLPGSDFDEDTVSVIVLGEESQYCGLAVDRFIGEQDLAVRPLDPRLGKVPHISAAAVTESGDPLLIVDIEDMLQSIRQLLGEGRLRGVSSLTARDAKRRSRVLVVDDSITVREVQRQLLSLQGYEVDIAVDGQDGWHALNAGSYDLLITDVDMPRMNGIQLIRTVRGDSRFTKLPIIIVSYKDREEDRMLGLEVGANAYLTKGSFHDDSFIRTVSDLIGESE